MASQPNAAQQAAQINAQARAAINALAVKRVQQVSSQTVVPANVPVLTINPINVGLIKGFWLQVQLTVHNGSAVQLDLTDFGPANALAQIQFNDLSNVTRIQTTGWHMHFVNSMKARRPFGTAFVRGTGIDTPIDYGAFWANQISAPATIAAGANGIVTMWYWLPLAYGDNDLRGAVYANVVNSTMQLFLSFPPANGVSIAVANGADSTQAIYVGDAAGSVAAVTISTATVTVQQVYLDQIPVSNGLPLLPIIDLATLYQLNTTLQTGMVTGAEFPYQYANFRDFLSTVAVYVENGTGGVRTGGSGIAYWALQSANASNVWKKTPALLALENRNYCGTDFPPGVYYFPTRDRAINTTQYGNMQLVQNPNVASNTPYQLVGVEYFALQQQLSMAGSLAAGG